MGGDCHSSQASHCCAAAGLVLQGLRLRKLQRLRLSREVMQLLQSLSHEAIRQLQSLSLELQNLRSFHPGEPAAGSTCSQKDSFASFFRTHLLSSLFLRLLLWGVLLVLAKEGGERVLLDSSCSSFSSCCRLEGDEELLLPLRLLGLCLLLHWGTSFGSDLDPV